MNDHPIIIGAGLAGLMTALHLAPQPVLVLSAAPLGEEAASAWAQGGLAAAIGDDDSVELHLADTLAAGAGLCDVAVARRIVSAGPGLVEELAELGAQFDRGADGRIGLGLEAGHGRRRIVHAAGDASGREMLRAVIAAVRRTPSVTVMEGVRATRLIVRDGAVAGVLVECHGAAQVLAGSRVVMATGGLGSLYRHSTNPAGAFGGGLMLAARAGAALADLEFVQFHPTALDVGGRAEGAPMPLVSEAVRGEGAVLVDETGERFMAGCAAWPRAELEPRDVVSRAVWARMEAGHRVFLDARGALGVQFGARFPGITAACLAAEVDPAVSPIPIRPAAHYHMGGISVDADCRSTLPGLWAVGEAACTGLHGANRLASNSLLEAAVTGGIAAESVAGVAATRVSPMAPLVLRGPDDAGPVRAVLSRYAGVLRDEDGLAEAVGALAAMPARSDHAALGLMMAVAMRRRRESRGGHWRTDYPQADAAQAVRRVLTLDEARAAAAQSVTRGARAVPGA